MSKGKLGANICIDMPKMTRPADWIFANALFDPYIWLGDKQCFCDVLLL